MWAAESDGAFGARLPPVGGLSGAPLVPPFPGVALLGDRDEARVPVPRLSEVCFGAASRAVVSLERVRGLVVLLASSRDNRHLRSRVDRSLCGCSGPRQR